MSTSSSRGFWALNAAQFLEVLNANAFKTLVALRILGGASGVAQAGEDFVLGTALFAAPFLLLSAHAGSLADRFSKRSVVIGCKIFEAAVMLAAIPVLGAGHRTGLFVLIFLLGVHSAVFGPAKMGLLPELLDNRKLSLGNGLLATAGFSALIAGIAAGGLLLQWFRAHPALAALPLVATALLGLLSASLIPAVPAAGGQARIPTDPLTAFWKDMRFAAKDHVLFLCLMGVGFFWMVGSLLYSGVLLYGKTALGLSDVRLGLLLAALGAGVALGGALAGKISGDKVEIGLVPWGSLGMGLLTLALAQVSSFWPGVVVLTCLGIMGGFFIAPLNAQIQFRAPPDALGRVTALSNVLACLGVFVAVGVFRFFTGGLSLNADGAAIGTGGLILVGTVYILSILRSAFVRMFLLFITNTAYRIEVRGRENFPLKGPALLVCNHLSYADPLLLSAAVHRPLHFFAWRKLFDIRGLGWIIRLMHAIPISPLDGPRKFAASMEQARQALREGHVVCVFAEGAISRVAQMLGFKKGVEILAKDLDVPIIPVHLDRVWGSIFSFRGGAFFFKMPRKLPYPVTVSFGKPLPPTAKAPEVRQAVMDLASDAFTHRVQSLLPLHRAFLRQATRQWTHEAVADSTGLRLTYGKLTAVAAIMAGKIMKACPEEGPVGVLLPPCVPAAAANIALALAGRVTVNLNYTLSREMVDSTMAVAGVRRILTSRKMLEALKWEPDPRMVFLEDLGRPSKLHALALLVAFRLLPVAIWERFYPGGRTSIDDLATLVFTSGSTGVPKGVMLTHANLQANVQGCLEVFQLDRRDTLVGVLPFFHSFGYMATLWFPLLGGVKVAYHRSPLEADMVARLIQKEKGTIVLITPTILSMWIRKFDPASVKGVRFFLTGAEKLREGQREEVEKRFGTTVLEGYGCTELSPVACVSALDVHDRHEIQEGHKPGKVGRPLPGVSVHVVDPETGFLRGLNQDGLILVKGPNVMKGYWNDPEKTAEVIKDGWYLTGDIGRLDEDGFVEITDRLSRFSKIGGEMVPHLLIEEKLSAVAGQPDARFFVGAVPDEKRGECLVVLHNGFTGDAEALPELLRAAGLPALWIPDKKDFHPIDPWPVLGTGKVDLGRARALAASFCREQA